MKDKPILAAVVAGAIFLAGAICAFNLPFFEYPTVAPPSVTVDTFYPGASADVIAKCVAAPIEAEINAVQDILYYDSKSDNFGGYFLTITFKPGTDHDMALVNVNNAIKLAEPKLPQEVKACGLRAQKLASDIVCMLAVHSADPAVSAVDLSTFADFRLKDPVMRIRGVGSTAFFGEKKRSLRCWLDPDRMRILGVTVDEITGAIASQNVQAAAGAVGTDRANGLLQFAIQAEGRLSTAEEFGGIVVRRSEDALRIVHLRDVARLEIGAERYGVSALFGGEKCVILSVNKRSDGDALQVAREVARVLAEARRVLPPGVEIDVAYDTTGYLRGALLALGRLAALAVLIAALVILLVRRSFRAALVAAVSMAVALVGAFAVMMAFGLSINILSLMALVLAVGIAADDAVAAIDGRSACLGTSCLVTLAVFLSLALMPGMAGAMCLELAIVVSAVSALSFVCARTVGCAFAPARVAARETPVSRLFAFCCRGLLRFRLLALSALAVAAAGAAVLYRAAPPAMIPDEDKGMLFVEVTLQPGTAVAHTEKVVDEIAQRVAAYEEVLSASAICGASIASGNGENLGAVVVRLKPLAERSGAGHSVSDVQERIMDEIAATHVEASVVAFAPPPILALGAAGGVTFVLQARNGQPAEEIAETAERLCRTLQQSGKAMFAFTTADASTPQLKFKLDRQHAEQIGVRVSDVFASMQGQLGSCYVNDFNLDGKNYQVNVQAAPQSRARMNQLYTLHVPGAGGVQVPVETLGDFDWTVGPRQVERFNLITSAALQAQTEEGVSSGELMGEIERQVKALGPGWAVAFTDSSCQERMNEGGVVSVLLALLVTVYLVLAGRFESWTVPLAVVFPAAVPVCGALAGIAFAGLSMNLYCQLALVLVIAMFVRAALQLVACGSLSVVALSATAIGLLPLAFASGAPRIAPAAQLVSLGGYGAAACKAVGIAAVCGLVSACAGLLFVAAGLRARCRLPRVERGGKLCAGTVCERVPNRRPVF